jgi:DNA-binding NtrC family response regulator
MNTTTTNTKKKALIIDDEVDVCFLLSGLLKLKNLDTEFVNSLSEAELILKKEQPGIIFLDNHLPDGFGVDYISSIKSVHPTAKVVMITAHDTNIDRDKAFKLGADHFIGKPFTRDTIYQTIEQLSA